MEIWSSQVRTLVAAQNAAPAKGPVWFGLLGESARHRARTQTSAMFDALGNPAKVCEVALVGGASMTPIEDAIRSAIAEAGVAQVEWGVARELAAVASVADHFPVGTRVRRAGFLLSPTDADVDLCPRGHPRAWLRDGSVGRPVDAAIGHLAADLLDCDIEVVAGCLMDDGGLELELAAVSELDRLLEQDVHIDLAGGRLETGPVTVTVSSANQGRFLASIFDEVEGMDQMGERIDRSHDGLRCTWCGDPTLVAGFAPGVHVAGKELRAMWPARRACVSHLGMLIAWLQERKDPS